MEIQFTRNTFLDGERFKVGDKVTVTKSNLSGARFLVNAGKAKEVGGKKDGPSILGKGNRAINPDDLDKH